MMRFSVAKNFSLSPSGRTAEDGPYNGAALRALLLKLLREEGRVEVDLNNTLGYSSSFLEAAFEGLGSETLLTFVCDDESIVMEIQEYMASKEHINDRNALLDALLPLALNLKCLKSKGWLSLMGEERCGTCDVCKAHALVTPIIKWTNKGYRSKPR